MFEIRESMPNVLRDLETAGCRCPNCPPSAVTEWVLTAKLSTGEVRVYSSSPEHTDGLLTDAQREMAKG